MEGSVAFRSSTHLSVRSLATPQHGNTTTRATAVSCAFLSPSTPSHSAVVKLDLQRDQRAGFPQPRRGAKLSPTRASIGSGEESVAPIAPFQPESPTGKFLTQLLQSHPHLVPAAVEHELERLAENREAEDSQAQPNPSGTELVLYRRIAELKVQERRKALEEIIYTLIVQKFVEAGISMVPDLSFLTSAEKSWPVQAKELEAVHSDEVIEMIQEHLVLVLGGPRVTEHLDENTVAQISKLRVGQVYAASIIYGYFLRRVYQRFQLEKNVRLLPSGLEGSSSKEQAQEVSVSDQDSLSGEVAAAMAVFKALGTSGPSHASGVKPRKLQSYVMSFDRRTLQGFATVRSNESLRVLEKHTEALFGNAEIQISSDGSMRVDKDEAVRMSFGGLKGLVLEAVAFGSFMWDVETYVDSHYSFVAN